RDSSLESFCLFPFFQWLGKWRPACGAQGRLESLPHMKGKPPWPVASINPRLPAQGRLESLPHMKGSRLGRLLPLIRVCLRRADWKVCPT
ncbi:MAG: hypothetical protein K9M45_09925, partial [Kiritimatiellales bacterium]|nr:hypothetical protein [Kiritimatiellales bacterium]